MASQQWNEARASHPDSQSAPLRQWNDADASPNHSQSSFLENKEGTDKAAYDNDIRPQWRRRLSSKLFWFFIVMAFLLLGLVLGLSIGLTQGKKQQEHSPSHPAVPTTLPPRPAQLLGPEIDLGYSKIQGLSYPNGISQWLGVRYAQPPLGDLRFAAPQNVTANSTTQMATQVRSPFSACSHELLLTSHPAW